MSFGLKPTTTKYLQVAKSFSKLFLETDKYAGFCGILHATHPKICNNNHSIRGMIYTDILFSTFYTCIKTKLRYQVLSFMISIDKFTNSA